jgi:hypothetical protein
MFVEAKKSRWSAFCWPCLALAMHCGPRAKFESDPKFSGEALQRVAVLVLPIAVTDDLGDERTGIVLDQQSREQATKLACTSAASIRDDVKIVCFDHPELAASVPLTRDLLLDYARDRAISAERWHDLARRTGASFVLLFRPEAVSASQTTSKKSYTAAYFIGAGLSPTITALSEGVGPRVGSVTTSRTYTLSSSLVDLREGKTVRVGVQSAKESTSTTEAPVASVHLHGIMRDLMKGQLKR